MLTMVVLITSRAMLSIIMKSTMQTKTVVRSMRWCWRR